MFDLTKLIFFLIKTNITIKMWNMAYACGGNDNDSDVSPYMTIMIKIFYLCQILYGVVIEISHTRK
jgi:hypothetical protein